MCTSGPARPWLLRLCRLENSPGPTAGCDSPSCTQGAAWSSPCIPAHCLREARLAKRAALQPAPVGAVESKAGHGPFLESSRPGPRRTPHSFLSCTSLRPSPGHKSALHSLLTVTLNCPTLVQRGCAHSQHRQTHRHTPPSHTTYP